MVAGSLAHHLLVLSDNAFIGISERAGTLGVESFFIISGYIITTLMLKEERKTGGMSVMAFYVRRVCRIVPPFFTYVFFVAGFAALGWITFDFAQMPYAMAFLCNTNVAICDWNLIQTWTLATEEQFYILWPLLFVVLPRQWRAPFVASLIGALLVFSSAGLFVAQTWIDNAHSFVCIALGALYALSAEFRAGIQKYGLRVSAALLLALGVLDVLPSVHLSPFAHLAYRELAPLFILTCILYTYRLPRLAHTKLFSLVTKLGVMSYSIYLWQQVFTNGPETYPAGSPLRFALLLVVIAPLSYFFIEKPAVRFGKEFLRRNRWLSRTAGPGTAALVAAETVEAVPGL